MLYTRKGDQGTTKTFGCNQRISKNSNTAEALGALDEINSFLGLVKVHVKAAGTTLLLEENGTTESVSIEAIVHGIQENLFTIQAQVAGFPKPLSKEKITTAELIVDTVEKELPPITTFFISGGTELAALFDISRTLARRAERRVVGVYDDIKLEEETVASASVSTSVPNSNAVAGDLDAIHVSDHLPDAALESGRAAPAIEEHTLAYLNRLSSVLYALARHANHVSGITETPPSYS